MGSLEERSGYTFLGWGSQIVIVQKALGPSVQAKHSHHAFFRSIT